MMAQVGIYSASLLAMHNHLNDNMGGVLNEYSRYGAYRRPYRGGALALHCDNDALVVNNIDAGYVLMKEILINTAQVGTYRISWRMYNSDNATTVESRFYVNGAAVGAIQSTALMAPQIKTANYDVDLAAGDRLQIYGNRETDTVNVDQFRIYYDWRIEYFGDGTSRVLVTALPLSDADLLDFTAVV